MFRVIVPLQAESLPDCAPRVQKVARHYLYGTQAHYGYMKAILKSLLNLWLFVQLKKRREPERPHCWTATLLWLRGLSVPVIPGAKLSGAFRSW